MGETSIRPDALRAGADGIDRIAQLLAELPWPTIEPTALAGARVRVAACSPRAALGVDDVIADMRAWAAAARTTAAEFERAELSNADGLPLP
jgi:hypothetical protein